VEEALAPFGVAHCGSYRFLVSLSDHVAHFGLEHHASSDDRPPERAGIAATHGGAGPLELLVENDDYIRTYPLNYQEGEKYPRLERDAEKPDLLSEILKPLAPATTRSN
jgi:hypothetical protein